MGTIEGTSIIETDNAKPACGRPLSFEAPQAGRSTAAWTLRHLVIGGAEFAVALGCTARIGLDPVSAFLKVSVVRMVSIVRPRHDSRNIGIAVGRVVATDPKSYFKRPTAEPPIDTNEFGSSHKAQ